MEFDTHKAILTTFCEALQYIVLEETDRLKNDVAAGDSFYVGYMDGLYRVLTLLEQQSEIYGLSLGDLGIDKITPQDLL